MEGSLEENQRILFALDKAKGESIFIEGRIH
jgi:hypothetical protein